MRMPTAIVAALTGMAIAGPVSKRGVVVTVWDVVIVTTTVAATQEVTSNSTPQPTRLGGPEGKPWYWPGHDGGLIPEPSKEPTPEPKPSAEPSRKPSPDVGQGPPPQVPSPSPESSREPSKSEPSPSPEPSTQPPVLTPGDQRISTYQRHVIEHHNIHRRNHSVPDIQWDQSLADTALKIAKTCVYAHDVEMDGAGYGQNIAAGAEETNITAILTELFYNQEMMNFEKWYGVETPDDIHDHDAFISYGHFTQIVWAETTHVGCATYDCRFSGKGIAGLENVSKECSPFFTVCNYKTPGNYPGQFNKNVNRPLGHPVLHWDYNY